MKHTQLSHLICLAVLVKAKRLMGLSRWPSFSPRACSSIDHQPPAWLKTPLKTKSDNLRINRNGYLLVYLTMKSGLDRRPAVPGHAIRFVGRAFSRRKEPDAKSLTGKWDGEPAGSENQDRDKDRA